ncbi:hypothetical protein ACFXI6_51040 [Streptomyces mirabilis]|uniref:hypothetical protein n=1 Tax=Streptomyces mirabilis TaxID=68239 RepID=UPI0036CAE6C1
MALARKVIQNQRSAVVESMSRSKGYDPVRRGEFFRRVLLIGPAARVVTASLLRVLESGEPEYNGAASTSTNPS